MKDPVISIDRRARKWTLFDGAELVVGFTQYEDPQRALEEARAEVAKRTSLSPTVVYPNVSSMHISVSRK